MMWETKTFEELYLEPSRNGIYKPKEFHGRGCKIVNMGELFAYDFVGQQDMKRVELNEKELVRDTLKDGDILFGRRSLVESGAGKSSIVKNLNEPTTYESSVIRLRLNKKHSNPYFYYYWLLSPSGKGAIASIVTGANVKGIKSSDLKNIVVPTPTLPTQNKIVGILSAYDDLIENNLKRIKLLEKMAQITYEEWFVHLRFPGHESTPINPETDLPEGWEKLSLSQIGEYLNGYAFKPKDLGDEGMPIIKIKEIKGGVVYDTPRNTGEKIPEKYLVETGQILFSWSASLEVVIWQYERGLLNQHLFKVTPKKGVSKAFLFLALKEALKVFDGLTTGATMKHIKRKELDFVQTAVPNNRLMQEFDVLVGAVIEEILNLSKQNQRLREARDILLPRLMTGIIDVEEYDPSQLLKEAA